MITILHEQRTTEVPQTRADGERLWLTPTEVDAATGWNWKPEGLCQGDLCVPLPRADAAAMVHDDRLDIAAMWRYMGHPAVHDDGATTWVLGTGAMQRAQALTTLQAPDFTLPDLAGKSHQLADYRGRRVFLATWASW